MRKSKSRVIKRILAVIGFALILLFTAFFLYVSSYYRADETALAALETDETVTVTRTGYGWLFDGPSQSDALIFYPGGKVEETAYAPLLHLLAREGMDAMLVSMPFRLAVFGAGKASDLISGQEYENWYIGGHSLGGAMAAGYVASHPEHLAGLYLLAAYPTGRIADSVRVTTIYGSGDGVLNMKKLSEGERLLPEGSGTYVIEGGNHAQFGSYGAQRGDGRASIPAEEQQEQTVRLILQNRLS